ncbi:DUF2624 domain-containing protein [Alkalihalophilus marmarensis]|jgi:hypothetical protein|uniref:DUF2624 domain-containing protein n=1 Tax=Alkalihalophilus marmarensis DSM 21297 TaxID=1188261 RepID=U6SV44_9BACI|nr:DUF2624 domain-containing protein [Alkalihalophilus marmarensis]ERN54780.1 hypothetical protein A33I_05370 [Alkalihalophilus marmarensis DSM 21297]MCM3488599.1 DUF2624 domain-containing protein [Alkalihalophilus marmarensis]
MNSIMQQLVNQKVNSLTAGELMQLSSQYQIPLTKDQAEGVINVLREEQIDVGNADQVNKIIQKLQTEVDPHVSSIVTQLLQQFGHFL